MKHLKLYGVFIPIFIIASILGSVLSLIYNVDKFEAESKPAIVDTQKVIVKYLVDGKELSYEVNTTLLENKDGEYKLKVD